MIGRLRSTMQRLGVAVALVLALSLAGPSKSNAAPSNASETGYVNGLPCNNLCKAYMAWSDRVMGKSSRPPDQGVGTSSFPPPRARIAVRHRRPDRTVDRAAGTRHLDLNSFTQVIRRSDAAAKAAETPQVTAAARPAPVNAIAERRSPATGIATARPADAGSSTNEPPRTPLVSFIAPISATQDTSKTEEFARGHDGRLMAPLALTLCALLSLLYLVWVWFGQSTQDVNRIR
jgi:hypothetical protein